MRLATLGHGSRGSLHKISVGTAEQRGFGWGWGGGGRGGAKGGGLKGGGAQEGGLWAQWGQLGVRVQKVPRT